MTKGLKLKLLTSTFVLLTVLITANVYAQDAVINVQGVGAIDITPNAYKVTLVLEEEGDTVNKLNNQLNADLSAVVTFLIDNGIEQQHIQSMQVRLQPRYVHTPEGRKQQGFTLSREVSLTSTDLTTYDRVIDGVLKRGVDRIQQFDFIAFGEGNAYERALVAAVKDATHRAQLLAKQLHIEVGEVVAISESGGNMPVPVMRAEAMVKDMSMSLPGQERVEARINVTFKIVQ